MNTRPVLPLTGGCSCGAIRYEIASFPLLLYSCNCTDCQTASGSAFALNMPVFARDFHILQGAPKPWRHISPMGVAVISWFCGDCGGRIHGDRAGREQIVNVRAGTLDDTSWLVPVAHMYIRSAQPWLQPAANAECHEIGPSDFAPFCGEMAGDVAGVFPAKIVTLGVPDAAHCAALGGVVRC